MIAVGGKTFESTNEIRKTWPVDVYTKRPDLNPSGFQARFSLLQYPVGRDTDDVFHGNGYQHHEQ